MNRSRSLLSNLRLLPHESQTLRLDRAIVQQFWEGIRDFQKYQETEKQEVLSLLNTYPELAHVRFQDYQVMAGLTKISGNPLQAAVFWGNLDMAERLIALGTDVNVGPVETALFTAVTRSFADSSAVGTEIIDLLLRSGSDPNILDNDGEGILHTAMGKVKAAVIVPLLLRYGADPNGRDRHGCTPLHFWREQGTVGWVENYRQLLPFMVAHGADINAVNKKGETVLIRSILFHCYAVAELIGYGADVHVRTRDGWTALHEATMRYHGKEDAETITLLLNAGAYCNVADKRGYTPLHIAAAFCEVGAARLLLEGGADIHASSKKGETPLALAEKHENPFDSTVPSKAEYRRMAAFLLEQGAGPTQENEFP